jgi:hypothetical protein
VAERVPVKAFIIFRDRVTYAHLCLTAMTEAGLDPVIIDQGSTWPLAKDYLKAIEVAGVQVMHRGGGHPRTLWDWEPFREACGTGRYVVTDCDVVPSEECPLDWPGQLSWLLDRHPEYSKAGLGLRLDRIPDTYQRKDHVLKWERKFWADRLDGAQLNGAKVYKAPVDTTLALYQPLTEREFDISLSALRIGHPYVADHLAWYEDYAELDEELRYYHEHAEPGISYWTVAGRSAWGI